MEQINWDVNLVLVRYAFTILAHSIVSVCTCVHQNAVSTPCCCLPEVHEGRRDEVHQKKYIMGGFGVHPSIVYLHT